MRYSTPKTADALTQPRPERLTDFGVHLSRELIGETVALTQALALASGGDDIDDAVLDGLTPERAAHKRRAIEQRRARTAAS